MKIRTIMGAIALLLPLQALPWGQKGHDTVAAIAENHLTPEAKQKAEQLLGGKSIVYYANWMDNASHTPEYAYSKTWHYKNIDADETYWKARLNEKGDIVRALDEQISILSDTTANDADRSLALKMVIHFLGDIHQPLHLGHQSDLGGNKWVVKWFKNPTNLHTVWDSRVVEYGHKWSYTEWQQQIDRATPEETAVILEASRPIDWGKESYELSKEIYSTTKQNSNLEFDYIAKWTPVIEQQLLKGGLRLAEVLNRALK